MFCEKCGAEIMEGEKFCVRCGTRIEYTNQKNVIVSSAETSFLKTDSRYVGTENISGAHCFVSAAEPTSCVSGEKPKKKDYRIRMLVMTVISLLCLTFLPVYEVEDTPVFHNDILRTVGVGMELAETNEEELNEEIGEGVEELVRDCGITNERAIMIFGELVKALTDVISPELMQIGKTVSQVATAAFFPIVATYIALLLQLISSAFNFKILNRIACLTGIVGIFVALTIGDYYVSRYNYDILSYIGIGMWAMVVMFVASFCVTLKK